MYDMGPSGFTSLPEEFVLQISLLLKVFGPRPGWNPQTLGPVVSTLPLYHQDYPIICLETWTEMVTNMTVTCRPYVLLLV